MGKLVVEGVEPESPAAKAGLKKGDVVVRVEKESVGSPDAFRETLQSFAPGESINISILRNREPVSVKATLAATSRPIPLNQQKPTLGFEVGAAKAGWRACHSHRCWIAGGKSEAQSRRNHFED